MIHPKITNFIDWLQKISSENDARIVKLLENNAKYKARNKKYEKMDKVITETLENYEVFDEFILK